MRWGFAGQCSRNTVFLSWLVIALSAYPYPQGPLLESTPTELKAVLNYAVDGNSPEVVNGVAYPMRVRGSVGLDIDSDGAKMVFVWTEPHFRQSPTITIYRVWPDGRVTRAVEGLAPGELVAASGEAVVTEDLHTRVQKDEQDPSFVNRSRTRGVKNVR